MFGLIQYLYVWCISHTASFVWAASWQNLQNGMYAQWTQIILGIRPVWSESSLFTWRSIGSLATHWAQSHFVGFVMRRLKYRFQEHILWEQLYQFWASRLLQTQIKNIAKTLLPIMSGIIIGQFCENKLLFPLFWAKLWVQITDVCLP